VFHRSPSPAASAPPAIASGRIGFACSAPSCASHDAVRCSYVDRRQRQCDSAWCGEHHQIVFSVSYCRRHAGIITALGPEFATFALPDLENRAPSLANWIGRELDAPIRELLLRHFPGHPMQVTSVVNGGGVRERTWGRAWKLISETGVDLSINVTVPEADDSIVRVIYEGRALVEVTPPWIEARRDGVALDPQADHEARGRFYSGILQHLDAAISETKSGDRYRLRGL
jgi:hypothetical protein